MPNAAKITGLLSTPKTTVKSEVIDKEHVYMETSTSIAVKREREEECDVWLDASVTKTEDGGEMDVETAEDTLVTITIHENRGSENIGGESQDVSRVEVTKSVLPPDCTLLVRQCFKDCLKLCSGTWISVDARSPRASCDQSECSSSSESGHIACFLCSDTFLSFSTLKEHLMKSHSLVNDAYLLSDPTSKLVALLSKELKLLECKCSNLKRKRCLDTNSKKLQITCQQCTVLGKLHKVNNNLFMQVVQELESCYSDTCSRLTRYTSSGESFDNYEESVVANPQRGKFVKTDQVFSNNVNMEVVCYSMLQQPGQNQRKEEKQVASKCICPLLKCPGCPKTAACFRDLRKHIRLNDHNSCNGMKLIWRKYKLIKEHCPACPRYPYLVYFLCPHCPHMAFKDECSVQSHMHTSHSTNRGREGSGDGGSLSADCTCSQPFTCPTCGDQHWTSTGLHHDMRSLGHDTQENSDTVHAMLEKKMKDSKNCPHCSPIHSKILNKKSEYKDQCSCTGTTCDLKQPADECYTEGRLKKVAVSSFRTCNRCSSIEDSYCIFCNKKENFIYYHIKTQHQDQQILLLSRDDCTLLDEFDLMCKSKEVPKYECSVCLQRFLHSTTLRRHVQKIHPDCFFTIQCLDLSQEKLAMKDFAQRKEIKILAVTSKGSE